MKSSLPQIILNKGEDRRLNHGFPWGYSNQIKVTNESKLLPAGALVEVMAVSNQSLGVGYYNRHSLIALRMLEWNGHTSIDSSWFSAKLKEALGLRERFFNEPYYRLVHSEADGLPGLTIDRYKDVFVVQITTAGMELLTSTILEALHAIFSPKGVLLKNTASTRTLEGLALETKIASGEIPETLEVSQGGVMFYAHLLEGQKTGWFFDQREERYYVAGQCKDKTVLDVYSYSGGFGILAAVEGAKEVTLVDRSTEALALAQRSAVTNNVQEKVKIIEGKAFDILEELAKKSEKYDVVVLDPPSFVKSRKDINSGLKGYEKLLRLALPIMNKGGLLFFASCSHLVSRDDLMKAAAAGFSKSSRNAKLIRIGGNGPDHPIHPQLAESEYLHTLTYIVN